MPPPPPQGFSSDWHLETCPREKPPAVLTDPIQASFAPLIKQHLIPSRKQNMTTWAVLSTQHLRWEELGSHDRVQHIDDFSDADARRLADELLKGYPEALQDLLPHRLPSCSSKAAVMTSDVLLFELQVMLYGVCSAAPPCCPANPLSELQSRPQHACVSLVNEMLQLKLHDNLLP